MILASMINAILCGFLIFTFMNKRLSPLENMFSIFVLVFFISTYTDILFVNLKRWEIADDIQSFATYRLYETILLPVIFLCLINWIKREDWLSVKCGKVVFVSIFLLIIRKALHGLGVINYHDWSPVHAVSVYVLNLFTVELGLKWFRYFTRKGCGTNDLATSKVIR